MFAVAEPPSTDSGSLSAYFEKSEELLRTLADVLDVRSVFPRVSQIANRMLPHDALTMSSQDEHLNIQLEATSSDDFRGLLPHLADVPIGPEFLIGDLRKERLPIGERPDLRRRIDAGGYRSLLRIVMPTRDRVLEVGFWSKQTDAYDRRQVPLARRIADHLALGISHERLATSAAGQTRGRDEDRERRVRPLSHELNPGMHARVVGESAEWQEVLRKATLVASAETTVLISGESGTGKEVVARYIHRASTRRTGPFLALNCAAMPEQLLEAELFGYERGAFTSAQQSKPGQLELAAGGVLFLDEVSEMSLSAQAKFLRVLQEREFQRLGGTKPLKANIRVIAATNRDLLAAVDRGQFREDLYYRLQVFDLRIEPLRERRADILPLSETFLEEIGRTFARPPARLTRPAQQALLQHDWPGNVRELRNALERAAILCTDGRIEAHDLALQSRRRPRPGPSTDLDSMARDTIAQVLNDCRWNKAKAARRLGLSRTQLYIRMRKYELEPPASAPAA